MTILLFKGYTQDVKKISFTRLLHNKATIRLKEAKEIMDRILDDEVVELQVLDYNIANEIVNEAIKLGFICEIQ
jgi:hypothetical protein